MEIEKTLSLTRSELAELLKGIAKQLEEGVPVRSEALDAEVNPEEPVLVDLEYEEEHGKRKMDIDIKLVASMQPQKPTA